MPTFETIKKHAPCWPESRLRERAKLWPDPLTWEWFLGERCAEYSRAECVEFLAVAIAFIQAERVSTLPMSARALWLARRNAEPAALIDALAALGVVLDLWEMGDRQPPDDEVIEALLNYATSPGSSSSSSREDAAEKTPNLVVVARDGGIEEGVSLPPRESDEPQSDEPPPRID